MTAEGVVAFAEALARIAAAGGGPQGLAAHLASEVSGSVIVRDAAGTIVATAGRSVTDRRKPGLPILAGSNVIGELAVFDEGGAALQPTHVVRLTAGALAVELARGAPSTNGYGGSFWDRLLDGVFLDALSARDEAVTHGIAAASTYTAVCFDVETPAQIELDHAQLGAFMKHAFASIDANATALHRAGTRFILVGTNREVDAANARTAAHLLPRTLAKNFPGVRLSAGVGDPATLLNVAQSVSQGIAAMTIGRRIFGPGHIAVYEELGAYAALLEGWAPVSLRDFAARTLAPLRSYDEKHQTELLRTLARYVALGENVKTAAAELAVHRHTVLYRLRQISEICGIKLENPHDQLTLRMALAIDALNDHL